MPKCIVCEESITQPLCGGCLEHQVTTWLQEHLVSETALEELHDVSDEILIKRGLTTCIKCHTAMGICSYCYLLHVQHWLQLTFPELRGEFMRYFGFQMVPDQEWDSPRAILEATP